jgi:hypothetical protein
METKVIKLFPIVLALSWGYAFAEPPSETGAAPSTEAIAITPEAPSLDPAESTSKKTKRSKGKVAREKEAEGTQAPKRFDTDIIIKSKYQLNGQALEVDTD